MDSQTQETLDGIEACLEDGLYEDSEDIDFLLKMVREQETQLQEYERILNEIKQKVDKIYSTLEADT